MASLCKIKCRQWHPQFECSAIQAFVKFQNGGSIYRVYCVITITLCAVTSSQLNSLVLKRVLGLTPALESKLTFVFLKTAIKCDYCNLIHILSKFRWHLIWLMMTLAVTWVSSIVPCWLMSNSKRSTCWLVKRKRLSMIKPIRDILKMLERIEHKICSKNDQLLMN